MFKTKLITWYSLCKSVKFKWIRFKVCRLFVLGMFDCSMQTRSVSGFKRAEKLVVGEMGSEIEVST